MSRQMLLPKVMTDVKTMIIYVNIYADVVAF